LENLLTVGLLVRTNVVHCKPFWGYLYELRHLLSALGSDMHKKFYIGAHLHFPP